MDTVAADADARHGRDVSERFKRLKSGFLGCVFPNRRGVWLGIAFSLLIASPVFADGPHIAFHATEGACTVTLFSAPDPLVAGPVTLTLLVQHAGDGSLVNGATATGELTLPGAEPVRFALRKGGSGNGQLPGATVQLKAPGTYSLGLQVAAGTAPVRFTGTLPVEVNNGRRNTVLWAVLMPFVLALLFLANQHAKQQLRCPANRRAV